LGNAVSTGARAGDPTVNELRRVALNFHRGISEREANAIWKDGAL
jgi:hypothetical protein